MAIFIIVSFTTLFGVKERLNFFDAFFRFVALVGSKGFVRFGPVIMMGRTGLVELHCRLRELKMGMNGDGRWGFVNMHRKWRHILRIPF